MFKNINFDVVASRILGGEAISLKWGLLREDHPRKDMSVLDFGHS
jgi:hypothetical protein